MKICIVGPANSIHIKKLCQWLNSAGHETSVISFFDDTIEGTPVFGLSIGVNPKGNDFQKLRYFFAGRKIKHIVDEIKPDVIHVHYASSYGVAVGFSRISDYILSVWGSDVYDFPRKSLFHRLLLKHSLYRASLIMSTSQAMAKETNQYTNKSIEVTPFGVDLALFNPCKRTRLPNDGRFIVGTVKGLDDKYGIRYLILAVAKILNSTSIPIELRIAGRGEQEEEYQRLAAELGVSQITTWLGFICQDKAAEEWANMDVAVIPSVLESFGVAAVEAQACGTAVIVSDIPGLMESTCPGESSIVVPREDALSIAEEIKRLYYNDKERIRLSRNGRAYVEVHYEINQCYKRIETNFHHFVKEKVSTR